jgi:hypothetical protein
MFALLIISEPLYFVPKNILRSVTTRRGRFILKQQILVTQLTLCRLHILKASVFKYFLVRFCAFVTDIELTQHCFLISK